MCCYCHAGSPGSRRGTYSQGTAATLLYFVPPTPLFCSLLTHTFSNFVKPLSLRIHQYRYQPRVLVPVSVPIPILSTLLVLVKYVPYQVFAQIPLFSIGTDTGVIVLYSYSKHASRYQYQLSPLIPVSAIGTDTCGWVPRL